MFQCQVLFCRSSLRGSKHSNRDNFSAAIDQQQHFDADHYEDNSRFRPSSRQLEDSSYFPHPAARRSLSRTSGSTGFRIEDRQNYDDVPHPLEENLKSSRSRQNGHAYSNAIAEEDDDIATAMYVPGGSQQLPSKLPPLESTGKKKKKKKFLKKVAENSPRAPHDLDDL